MQEQTSQELHYQYVQHKTHLYCNAIYSGYRFADMDSVIRSCTTVSAAAANRRLALCSFVLAVVVVLLYVEKFVIVVCRDFIKTRAIMCPLWQDEGAHV